MAAKHLTTADALAELTRSLDAIDHAARTHLGHPERLALVSTARSVARRVEALVATLVGEAEDADSAMKATRTPLPSLLAATATQKNEAPRLVRAGRLLAGRPAVRDAALAGRVSLAQARSIGQVLDGLPATLTPEQRAHAEAALVSRADTRTAEQLTTLGADVLAEVAPDAVATEHGRLEAQSRRARQRRSLSWWTEDGSTHLHACLPVADAAGLIKLVEAHLEDDRRSTRHQKDTRSPEQRRADALVALLAAHHQQQGSPAVGGDRPRVVVVLDHDRLRERAEGAGVLDSGEALSAGDLRRLCCDADLVPAVLGADSEVLDLGRTARLVTPAVRIALDLRDGGCIFPRCDLPPSRCQAHHIVPWWAGGATDRDDLALLCPTHHSLVEPRGPAGEPTRDQWRVWFNPETGKPECIPPLE